MATEKRTKQEMRGRLIAMYPRMRGDETRLEEALRRIVAEYPDRARDVEVFRMYYGVGEHDVHTLTEIAKIYGLSDGNLSTTRKRIDVMLRDIQWWI